ncbi:MAG: AAA family ATPase [Christensenellaceae bacterium]|nr:AAA family ATPase [Christensenellaceae bacterium]
MDSKVWVIASGKGGVGKSTLVSVLSVIFAEKTMKTLVIDADIGLRNLDLLLGLQDKILYELYDFVNGRCTIEDALVVHSDYPNLKLLTVGQEAREDDFNAEELKMIIETLKSDFDIILIDSPTGIGKGFQNLLDLYDECILVSTPDVVSLRDVEKTASVINSKRRTSPYLVINRVDLTSESAEKIAQALDICLLGAIPESRKMHDTMLSGAPVTKCGDSAVIEALNIIASRMRGKEAPAKLEENNSLFNKIMRIFKGGA